MSEGKELNPRQEMFCLEYLKDLNATQAYLRAGYNAAEGNSAESSASTLLRNPKVAQRVQQLMDKRSKTTEVDANEVLGELKRLGFSDVRAIYDDMGNIKDPKDWPEDLARCVQSLEVFEEYQKEGRTSVYIGRTKKVKFWDKTKALDMMGRHKHLFAGEKDVNIHIHLQDMIPPLEEEDALPEKDVSE